MCLEDICPDALQIHLESKENLKTYTDYKLAINDFLINRERWAGSSSKPKVNWMGLPIDEGGDEDGDDDGFVHFTEEGIDTQHFLNSIQGEIMAMVKGKIKGKCKGSSPSKGKGKGTGKDYQAGDRNPSSSDVVMGDASADKRCFECNELFSKCGHLARDCPVRTARVAAGGPARLPKGKGKGKDGGKSGVPSRQAWNGYYPGPSQSQWRSWYPAPSGGKASLFQTPFQLSAVNGEGEQTGDVTDSVLHNLFNNPGVAYSLVEKGPKSAIIKSAEEVKVRNMFAALEGNNIDDGYQLSKKTIQVPLAALVKPPLQESREEPGDEEEEHQE